jgi:hypothetical protein
MKHYRLILYEGDPAWVSFVLSKSMAVGKTVFNAERSITIAEITEEEAKSLAKIESLTKAQDELPPS